MNSSCFTWLQPLFVFAPYGPWPRLGMQPGEFVSTRTIELRDSGVTCAWRLWDSQAEQFGDALLGRSAKASFTRSSEKRIG